MNQASPYSDKRSTFFREAFERGLTYDRYLATGSETHTKRWMDFAARLSLNPAQHQLIASFTRRMNVLVMSGIWCGDCARQGPMLRRIEEVNPLITMRLVDNREERNLQEELRINGAEKVPVVVVLSEDFFEVNRFGDRHLSVYRRKAAAELGPSCDPGLLAPPEQDLILELQEWVEYFERCQLMLRLSPMLRRRYND